LARATITCADQLSTSERRFHLEPSGGCATSCLIQIKHHYDGIILPETDHRQNGLLVRRLGAFSHG
jgi:hypothetical protein